MEKWNGGGNMDADEDDDRVKKRATLQRDKINGIVVSQRSH